MAAPKLSVTIACRVAGINRDRFNEHVSAGHYPCAPATVPGRTRYFDPDDMIALRLFRELMDDGLNAEKAGRIACAVASVARQKPDVEAISWVEDYFAGHGSAWPAQDVPPPEKWDEVLFSGTDIRKVTTFRIGKMRKMIAQYTDEEISYIGEN